jgi:hypothetical protein
MKLLNIIKDLILKKIIYLTLNPGDIIVMELEKPLSLNYIDNMKKDLNEIFPDNKIIIIQNMRIKNIIHANHVQDDRILKENNHA